MRAATAKKARALSAPSGGVSRRDYGASRAARRDEVAASGLIRAGEPLPGSAAPSHNGKHNRLYFLLREIKHAPAILDEGHLAAGGGRGP